MLNGVRLYQFRNNRDTQFDFSLGINGIFGPNGSGKTNILEAITLLSTGRSFRNASLTEMTLFGENGFLVDGRFSKNELQTKITLRSENQQKIASINGNQYPYFSSVLGIFPTVLYAPRDMALISGAPAERRRFWNILLAQGFPLYLHHLTRYTRALKQRNALLKKRTAFELEVWDNQLVQSGFHLVQMRRECSSALMPILQNFHNALSPEAHELSLEYQPSLNAMTPEDYMRRLLKSREKDFSNQTTNVGPHRDDFSLLLDNRLAKTYASEGQKRSALAALKCSEWSFLMEHADEPPLFCVDDCPAHLDEVRTKRFIDTLTQFPQVILTAPSAAPFPREMFSNAISTLRERVVV